MINSVHVNCDRCITTMFMMIIATIASKKHKYDNLKRHKYGGQLAIVSKFGFPVMFQL